MELEGEKWNQHIIEVFGEEDQPHLANSDGLEEVHENLSMIVE